MNMKWMGLKFEKFAWVLGVVLGLVSLNHGRAAVITYGGWTSTNSEVITNGGVNSSNPSFNPIDGASRGGGIWASFDSEVGFGSLAIGDSITLSGTLTLSGTSTGAADANQGIRFGLFDSNGSSDIGGWRGYLVSVRTTSAQMIYERTGSPSTTDYASTTTAGLFIGGNTTASGSLLAGAGPAVYTFEQTITKLSASSLSISASLVGGSFSSVITGVEDTTFQSGFNGFDRVGFTFSTAYDVDNAALSGLSITTNVVPEPSTWVLLAAGVLLLVLIRARGRRAARVLTEIRGMKA